MKLWCLDCQRQQNDVNSPKEVSSKIFKFFDLLTVGLGSSLAVGISVLIGGLIKNVTGPAVVASIALAGLAALVAGLCFAEFGVRFLKVNSAYTYSYIWSSENSAFVFGWALILQYVACTASAAKAIITFIDALADYKITEFLKAIVSTNFNEVFPYFDFLSLLTAIAVSVLYAFGTKDSIIVKRIFTICNAILIVSVIIIGGYKADVKNWEIEETAEEKQKDGFAPFGVIGIVRGAAIGFYGFIGFEEISVLGCEVKKRKRNIPLAILATIFITFCAYGGVGTVLTLMLPYYKLNLHAAVPFAFQEIGWTALKWVTALATFFGFQTGLFGAMYSLPNIIQAMGNDGLLFHCLGNNHPSTKVPSVAAITGGFISSVAAGIFPFQTLVNVAALGALFVYTTVAISVILFRYSPKFDGDEKLSESWMNLINNDLDVSMKAVMQNYFNFRKKQPTNITIIIIAANIVLFCLSSIGISVTFIYFYDSLFSCHYEAVIPVGILLCVMFCNLISMTCQPKCREIVPFRVPLIPFVPCLGIFLNIFLLVTFESLTWILFSIWMAIGLIPHFTWRLLKYLRGETGENSLYEINRTNSLKLNESIWKIKKDKKSFYQGAINPVFSDDLDDKFNANSEIEVKKHNETTGLQLIHAEIIQTAEVVTEEKAEPLEEALEFNFSHINSEKIVNDQPEDGQVQWECVAEIHTEEKFPQESVALEIVENNYNFLTEVSDEFLKSEEKFKETDSANDSDTTQNSERETISKADSNKYSDTINLKETVLEKNTNESSELPEKPGNILSETHTSQTVSDPHTTTVEKSKETKPKEQGRIKEFKEKLNQLLKNQVNNESARNSVELKAAGNGTVENQSKVDISSVKTLNKSQIKGKLEMLLAKGPPQRPSLGGSFNIKIKETDTEKELQTASDEVPKNQSDVVLNKEENFAISSSTLQDSIKQKILSLKNANSKRTTDVSC